MKRGMWVAFFVGAWVALALNLSSVGWLRAQPVPGAINGPTGAVVSRLDNLSLTSPTVTSLGGGAGTCASSCANVTLLGPVDTTGFETVMLNALQTGSGANMVFQGSIDSGNCQQATNWYSVSGNYSNPSGSYVTSNIGSGFSSTTVAVPTASVRCFRVFITSYASGTLQMEGMLKGGKVYPTPPSVMNINYDIWGSFGGASAGVMEACAATGTTSAVTCTLAGAGSRTTYICGFEMTSAQTSTAGSFSGTISNIEGSLTFTYQQQAAASGSNLLTRTFTPCIPASGQNTAIAISFTNANAAALDINAWGFQL